MEMDVETYDLIRAYLDEELSEENLQAFETRLAEDISLAQAVTHFKDMDAMYSEDEWILYKGNTDTLKKTSQLFDTDDVHAFSDQLEVARSKYKQQAYPFRQIMRYAASIAAIGVLLLGSYYFFGGSPTTQELYASYYTTDDLPSFTVKDDDNEPLAQAERLFKTGSYTEALALFTEAESQQPLPNADLLLYIAQTQGELGDYTQVHAYF